MPKHFDEKYIAKVTAAFLKNVSSFEIAALSSLQGLYLQRIHNRGEATDGSKIGKYVTDYWREKRKEKGRQVSYKDLEFNSDLRRSVKIGTSNGKNVMGFDNDMSRIIATGQQEQTEKTIFAISISEQNEMDDAYVRELEFQLKRIK